MVLNGQYFANEIIERMWFSNKKANFDDGSRSEYAVVNIKRGGSYNVKCSSLQYEEALMRLEKERHEK